MTTASPASSPRAVLLASGAIAFAGVAAYANSFSAPFVFLDIPAIVSNPSIRHLWPLGPVLIPPSAGGLAVGGRPLVNLSLAINYALGGTNASGYHAFNLAVHILAALTLFGIARRTLGRMMHENATSLGFCIALIWTVHPLQTESVTYIIERAESLMGLFYLLTLYCFIRYSESEGLLQVSPVGQFEERSNFHSQQRLKVERDLRARCATLTKASVPGGPAPPSNRPTTQVSGLRYQFFAVAACLCCAATKEVAATLPVIVFLYDRTFISGTFRDAWRRHWRLYLGLASSWVLSAVLLAGTGATAAGPPDSASASRGENMR